MTVFSIILIIIFCLYAGLILYYRRAWLHITGTRTSGTVQEPVFISVVVAARNEEDNIIDCLNALCRQDYPAGLFEVIVVDDHSEDATAARVQEFSEKFPFIRLFPLARLTNGAALNAYKKKAIEAGIQQSRGELIVTTDADCTAGPQWLSTIAAVYREKQAACLVMPVGIRLTGSGSNMLERFQALDVMTLQGITGASVSSGFHGMCNGANFAYTRKVFDEVGGFRDIDHIASGDDMLLLHKISALYPGEVHYIKSPAVIVTTNPEKNIRDFLQQRIRWAGKSAQYRDKSILPVLLLVYVFNLMLLAGLILACISLFQGSAVLAPAVIVSILLMKCITELFFLFPVAGFFGQPGLLPWFPLMQLPHIIYTVMAGFLGFFGRYEWKGRRVR